MRALRLVLTLIVGLWIVAEIAVIPFAENRLETEVAERSRDTTAVKADIDSFPLIASVLATGEARKLTVTLERVARLTLRFTEVRFELSGIHIDRSAILEGRARVDDIDRGKVTAIIDRATLGRLASLAGIDVDVTGRTLTAGRLSFPIADDIIPCDPQARMEESTIVLSCEIEEVPGFLLEAAQSG